MEIVGGFLVAFGLLTRLAAFISTGEMAVAFFHDARLEGSDSLREQGRTGVVYCFVFFFIFLRGSGRWSIDAMMGKGKASATTTA